MRSKLSARARRVAGIAGAVAMLVSCSGGVSDEAAPESDPTATILESPRAVGADTRAYDSPEALAKAIGCRDVQRTKNGDEVVAAESQAGCTLDAETVYLIMFADNDDRNRFVNLSDVMARPRLLGNGWVIQASPELLRNLQDSVGGELRSVSSS